MPFHFNADIDTFYARLDPAFVRVLHIFAKEWAGIRSAAGYLPGLKLAISVEIDLQPFLIEITSEIARLEPLRIVFHGWSDQAQKLFFSLAKDFGPDQLFIVFHGAPAQWHDDHDRRQALACLALAEQGSVNKLHFLKADFDLPGHRLFRPMLFNVAPRLPERPAGTSQKDEQVIAFVPARKVWTKNVVTNILGAALCQEIDRVDTTIAGLELPNALQCKVRRVTYPLLDPLAIFQQASVVLNVATHDCHPMINVEAQASGKPCLRGPLFLDALETHPYAICTTVDDVSSVAAIRRALERVLKIPAEELSSLIHDYQSASDKIALRRYRDFLDLD